MGAIILCFVVQRRPYKSENPRQALTHSISSQTAEIHLEDGESVVPTLIFVGDGVLNAVKNQQAMKLYGVTSTESHIKNGLLIDMPVWVCKEDMEPYYTEAITMQPGFNSSKRVEDWLFGETVFGRALWQLLE